MAIQTLRASVDGIEQIKAAIKRRKLNQTSLALLVGCTRQTIWGLLKGNPIDTDFFMGVCQQFGLDYRDVAEPDDQEQPAGPMEIDRLVALMRRRLEPVIQERCGTMRVLDMEKPIGLGDIYTDVNIFEKLTHNKRFRLEELQQACQEEDFEKFGYSYLRNKERVPGLEAVKRYSKVLILGKPGAGKTTFLKRVAIKCNQGEIYPDRVVLFITLKEFAEARQKPTLLEYIAAQLAAISPLNPPQAGDFEAKRLAVNLLQEGRMLLLLDGLDEVKKEDGERVTRDIKEFAILYPQNRFLLTCRIAAQEYTFETCTDIEIADFDDQQIGVFVTKWFAQKDPAKTELFLLKLREQKRVRELATNPLLLTLLCQGFEEANYLDPSRSGLYKEGLEVLLKKWDGKRNIERGEIYKNLKPERKLELLSQLAYNTFLAGNYFFAQVTAESEIRQYIANLPQSPIDPNELELDGEAVLKAITAQHGLLIERASEIYSFSHLTFHEYFTAQKIASLNSEEMFDQLVEHLDEKRWREVFLLTVEMLPRADLLLLKMKAAIDLMVEKNERLKKFLAWAVAKVNSVGSTHKPAAVRAFYLWIGNAINRTINISISPPPPPGIQPIFAIDLCLSLKQALDLGIDALALAQSLNLEEVPPASALDHALAATFERAVQGYRIGEFDHIIGEFDHIFDIAQKLGLLEFAEALQKLQRDVSHKNDTKYIWWTEDGNAWHERLRQVMIQHRNIGHDWQLSQEDGELLDQYLDANKLLVECLKSECYVTRTVREEIENTLLMPSAQAGGSG